MGGDGSSNLLVDQDGFLGKIVSGHLHKKWNGGAEHWQKSWDDHILATHGNGSMEINVLLGMILACAD